MSGNKTLEKNGFAPINWVWEFIKRNVGILIALVVLTVFLSFATENFATPSNLLTVLRQICTNALMAFGMTFVLIIGGIDLTVGSVLGMCGVSVVMLIEGGWSVAMAIIASIGLGAVMGLINGCIIAFTGMPPFIVTLSMQQVIRGIAYILTDGRSVGCTNEWFNSFGNSYFLGIPIPVYIVFVTMIVISVILYRTKFGRRMYAVGGNVNAAKFTGINTKSITIRAYVISAILSAIAGIVLASRMYSGQPTAGNGYESDAIAAAVLGGTSFNGGIGTLSGTLFGALVIGVLNNGLNQLKVSSYMQMVVKGIVIILAVGIDILKNQKRAK